MRTFSRISVISFSCILLAFGMILAVPLHAGQYEEEVSTSEYLYTKGMIHTVSATDQSIQLQQKKGPDINIFINPDTEFEGVGKLEELQKSQIIKLWYRPDNNGHVALKIVKLPDLGC